VPLAELATQRRSQHGSPKAIKMSSDNKRKRVASYLLTYCRGRSFHIEGPILAKARCRASAVLCLLH